MQKKHYEWRNNSHISTTFSQSISETIRPRIFLKVKLSKIITEVININFELAEQSSGKQLDSSTKAKKYYMRRHDEFHATHTYD